MAADRVRRSAPLVVAVLVLVAVGGTWLALRGVGDGPTGPGVGDGGAPPPLGLMGWVVPTTGGTPDQRYRLAPGTELPAGPGQARTWRMDPPPQAARLRLATALGFTTGGDATGGGWAWSGVRGGAQLQMTADGRWTFDRTPPPPPVPVPTAEAVRLVSELLHPLGLGAARVAASTVPTGSTGSTTVQADPSVDGRPTAGVGTVLTVSPGGVQGGTGWLVSTGPGPAYPLVGARTAWEQLVRTPHPMPMMACPQPMPPGTDPVPCGGPVTVTGARLGLSLQQSTDGYLLVPAWFFAVAGSDRPLVQVAVEPALVEAAAPTGGGSSGSSGSGGGALPSATVSAAPPSVAPGGSVPAPQSRFTAVLRSQDDRSLDVTFWGGVASCYAYEVRTEEDPQRVRVWLVERRPPSDKPCIDLAEERHATVRLERPLGQRTVQDGDTGAVLLGPGR